VFLEGHEVPDGRRHGHRGPKLDRVLRDRLQRIAADLRRGLGQTRAVVTEEVQQPSGTAEAEDLAATHQPHVLRVVGR